MIDYVINFQKDKQIPIFIFVYIFFIIYMLLSSNLLPLEARYDKDLIQLAVTTISMILIFSKYGKVDGVQSAILIYGCISIAYRILSGQEYDDRTIGTLGHPNAYALYLLIVFHILLTRVLFAKATMPRSVMIGYYAFALICAYEITITTGSRKGIAGIILLLLIYTIMKMRGMQLRKKILRASIFAFLMFTIGFAVTTSPHYERIKRFINPQAEYVDDASLNLREAMLSDAYRLWKEKPLTGWGLAQFRYIGGHDMYSHNNYLELLVDGGILGFVLYYLFYLIALLRLIRILRHARDNQISDDERQQIAYCASGYVLLQMYDYGAVTYNLWIMAIHSSMVFGMIEYIYQKQHRSFKLP